MKLDKTVNELLSQIGHKPAVWLLWALAWRFLALYALFLAALMVAAMIIS